MKRIFTSLLPLALASCAKVTAIPLTAAGEYDGTEKGIRYYLPKPYLLITELPVSVQPPTAAPSPAGTTSGSDTNRQSSSQTPQASVPTAAPTDTSFSSSMVSYTAKLIYLPDKSHPMALQMKSGLFGTVSMAPSLQDGWMLTSFNSSNDSGGAAALSAIASLVGSAAGGTASGGATRAAGAAGGGGSRTPLNAALVTPGTTTSPAPFPGFGGNRPKPELLGELVGEGLMKPPSDNAPYDGATAEDQTLFLTGLQKGHREAEAEAARAAAPVVAPTPAPVQIPWGRNVLPAGLYAFEFSPVPDEYNGKLEDDRKHLLLRNAGDLVGLRPVVFFCGEGAESPQPKQLPKTQFANGSLYDLYATPCQHDPSATARR